MNIIFFVDVLKFWGLLWFDINLFEGGSLVRFLVRVFWGEWRFVVCFSELELVGVWVLVIVLVEFIYFGGGLNFGK